MLLEKYLKDNIILVIPNNLKNTVLKDLNNLDSIFNLKIISLKELVDSITYTYDSKTIYYLVSNHHYKYDIALMYLENMKYFDNNNYQDAKFNELFKIKKELEEHNLLIYNDIFKN